MRIDTRPEVGSESTKGQLRGSLTGQPRQARHNLAACQEAAVTAVGILPSKPKDFKCVHKRTRQESQSCQLETVRGDTP